jgi:hypothetical protein
MSTTPGTESTKGRGSLGPSNFSCWDEPTTSSLRPGDDYTLRDDSGHASRDHPCSAQSRRRDCYPRLRQIRRLRLSWNWRVLSPSPTRVAARRFLGPAPARQSPWKWLPRPSPLRWPPSPRSSRLSSGALRLSCSHRHGRSMHPVPTRRISFRLYRLSPRLVLATILSGWSPLRRSQPRESNVVI